MSGVIWTDGEASILVESLVGTTTYRLVPSHFPTITLFDHLLDPEDLETAYELESMTNDRIREEIGDISIIAPQDRVIGPGCTPIMAAFTHTGIPSRFSNGGFGLYYAGLSVETAIAESSYSRARFYATTNEPACELTMRCYTCTVAQDFKDIRAEKYTNLHDPESWRVSQQYGAKLRAENKYGLWYRSVRNPGGECIAALKPTGLQPPASEKSLYRYVWDGEKIATTFRIIK